MPPTMIILKLAPKDQVKFIWIQTGHKMTYTTSEFNITNNNWHHLVTYGSDLKVFSDGTEVLQIAMTDHLIQLRIHRFLWEWLESSRISGAISMDRLTILEFTERS